MHFPPATRTPARFGATVLLWLIVVAVPAGADGDIMQRGEYLFRAAGCAVCHTDTVHKGAPLAGGRALKTRFGTFYTPNITPDRETGIGGWSDDELKRAIVEGKRPNHGRLPNTELGVVMATPFFKALTASDLGAVVAYLRSVPAIRNEVAPPVYRMPQQHQPFPDAETAFSEAKMSDPVYRGRYLATIAHCSAVFHSTNLNGPTPIGLRPYCTPSLSTTACSCGWK